MKIIVLVDSAAIDGGAAKVAVHAAIGSAEAGHDVHFIAVCGPVAPELAGVDRLKVTCLGQKNILKDPNRFRAATQGIANRDASNAIEQIFRQSDPETIVHIHAWSKALSALGIRTAVKSGLPVVMSLHDYFIACPNGGFYNYRKNEICHLTPVSLGCVACNCDSRSYLHKLWRTARSVVQTHFLGVPDCVKNYIVLSPRARNVQEPFLPSDATIYSLDNPISVVNSGRTTAEKNKEVLFVGRFSPEKGVMNLAHAVRDLGIPAVFVGDGHLRPELEKLLPNAEFTGWLNSDGVTARMRTARLLVFPSTWYEVQPLVPIEAAAQGLPSILSDCTSAIDYLPNNVRGLSFKSNSVEALKEQLVTSKSDQLIDQLSRNAYEWYWNNPWTLSRHVEELTRIYEQILDDHTKKG